MSTLKFKRGLFAKLPTLNVGEPCCTTDSKQVYLGTSGGNIELYTDSTIIPCCKAYASSNPGIGTSVYVTIPLDTATINNYSMWNSSSNTKLTCNKSGVYLINACFTFIYNEIGVRSIKVVLNGTEVIGQVNNAPSPTINHRMNLSVLRELSVNDYIELQVYQDSGSIIVGMVENINSISLSAVKVG